MRPLLVHVEYAVVVIIIVQCVVDSVVVVVSRHVIGVVHQAVVVDVDVNTVIDAVVVMVIDVRNGVSILDLCPVIQSVPIIIVIL